MSRVHHPECDVEVEGCEEIDAFECDDAEVWLEDEAILISYFDDDGIVVLEGWPETRDEAAGATPGWRLSARSRPRRAFLRPMAEAPGTYVGEIEQHGATSAWRLRLGGSAGQTDPT